jgi:hypothetical protein
MVCVIAEKFSCWRLATITQNITLNVIACVNVTGKISSKYLHLLFNKLISEYIDEVLLVSILTDPEECNMHRDLFKMQVNIYCFQIWDYVTRFKKEY